MDWIAHSVELPDGTLAVYERPSVEACIDTLVLLHGFTGNHRSWRRLADDWPNYRLLAFDLPGHGASQFVNEEYACSFPAAAAACTAALQRLEVNRFHLLGYSMGGRLALFLALTGVGGLQSLILESASPGLATEAERTQRQTADRRLAETILEEGLESFLARWEKTSVLQPASPLPPTRVAELRAERMHNRADGLASSLRGMGTGAQPWLGDRLQEPDIPVLLIVGEADAKFREIGSRMRTGFRNATLAVVPNAGHNVHLEAPTSYAAVVTRHVEANRQTKEAT